MTSDQERGGATVLDLEWIESKTHPLKWQTYGPTLMEECKSFRAQLAALTAESKARIGELESANQRLQTEVANLLNTIVGLNGIINDLRAELDNGMALNASLASRYSAVAVENERLKQERDDAIDAEKIALREIGVENERLQNVVEQHERHIHRLAAECVERSNAEITLARDLASAREQIARLKGYAEIAYVEAMNAENVRLKEASDQARAQCERMQRVVEAALEVRDCHGETNLTARGHRRLKAALDQQARPTQQELTQD